MKREWIVGAVLVGSVVMFGAVDASGTTNTETLVAQRDSIDELLRQGHAAYDASYLDEAETIYRQIIRLYPDHPEAYNYLGKLLKRQKKWDEALANYERAIVLNPNYSDAYNNLGLLLRAQGDQEAAITNYKHAIALNPDFANAHYNYLDILYTQGSLEKIATYYDHFIKTKRFWSSYQRHRISMAYYEFGLGLFKQGKLREAIKNYNRAIEIAPAYRYHPAYIDLGVALYRQGRLKEAVSNYNHAIKFIKNKFINTRWRSRRESQQLQKAYIGLGNVSVKQGKLGKAIISFKKALDLPDRKDATGNSVHALIYSSLGFLFQQHESWGAAIEHYEKALAIDASYDPARNNLREVRRLLGQSPQPPLVLDQRRPSSPCSRNNYKIPTGKNSLLKRSVVFITIQVNSDRNDGGGTGFVIARRNKKALILTNHHVITTSDENQPVEAINVEWFSELTNGEYCRQRARLLQQDKERDLALIEVDNIPDDIKPLKPYLGNFDEGAAISFIGHPAGAEPWSLGFGRISNTVSRLQITSPDVSEGNSGGPILDNRDRVIGILTQAIVPPEGSNSTGRFGLGYSLKQIQPILRRWNAME